MEQPKNDVLKVKRLHVEFQTSHGMVHAVKDVSLEVRRGRIHALVGESGSGKSVTSLTIMNLLAGNGKVISGDVTLNEKSLLKLSGKEKRQLYGDRIGMIFQDPTAALDPLFTVEQLLLEGLRKHRRMSKKQAREVALESLRMMNLRDPEELMKKKPYELSGGMCQRVMIAIAMSMKPDYLIADEPTTALDVTVQKQILEEIYQLSRKENLGVLFITHDLEEAVKLGDRIAIMRDGEIQQIGTSEEILTDPANKYVRCFVENVDRSRIITAASIMVDKPMVARQGKEGPEVLIRKMRERKITVLPVVDPDGILVGEVHLKELLQLRKERILNIDSIVRKEVHSILGDTVVEDILPLMTKTNSPIWVVNEKREFEGMVPLSSLIIEVTGKDKEEINEIIQNAIEL